jgi:hypothetical protein
MKIPYRNENEGSEDKWKNVEFESSRWKNPSLKLSVVPIKIVPRPEKTCHITTAISTSGRSNPCLDPKWPLRQNVVGDRR